MKKKSRYWIAVAIALCLAITAGATLTYTLARQRAHDLAVSELQSQLSEVMKRSADTRAQQLAIVEELGRGSPLPACSPAHIARMQTAFSSATYLQGMGVVQDNTLMCSTLLPIGTRIDLGPADRTDPSGFRSWNAVTLPGVGIPLKVDLRSGYAMLLVSNQVMDTGAAAKGISLAHVGMTEKPWTMVRQRGDYTFDGFLASYAGNTGEFRHDDRLILVRRVAEPQAAFLAAMDRARLTALLVASIKHYAIIGSLAAAACFALLMIGVRRYFSLRADIRRALKNREFHMHYQPVMSLDGQHFVGAEALIRWTRPNGRHVNPGEFIPAAERAGMIHEITQQVIELVAEDVARLVQELPGAHIAINLAPSDVDSPETQIWLTRMVERAGIDTDNVMVEITERGLLQPKSAKEKLASIRTHGFRLAIDDFGTGQSSLSQLATHRFDFLKIDKSFVDVICTDTLSSKVAFNVIHLAKSLGMQMIAEGVETDEQYTVLKRAGVQYAQGWLFAKAMPFDQLIQFARSRQPVPAV